MSFRDRPNRDVAGRWTKAPHMVVVFVSVWTLGCGGFGDARSRMLVTENATRGGHSGRELIHIATWRDVV